MSAEGLPPAEPAGAPRVGWKPLASDLYQISKPRILYLLLIVAWAAMFVAAGGWPDLKAFIVVTIAGACSTAASGALNHVLEAERDAKMGRTAQRPVASGRLGKDIAIAYAAVMAAISVSVLQFVGMTVAAWLTFGATVYYVLVYTVLLKPRTPQNIVIGGFAGSFPALIGWAAQTGGLAMPAAWPAWALALMVFLWTPAHFWALALLYKDDYAAAEYPMMPNIRGEASTRSQILVYTGLTVASSLILVQTSGVIYAAGAVILGLFFLAKAYAMSKNPLPATYRSFFFTTIQYLGVVLLVLMIDQLFVIHAAGI